MEEKNGAQDAQTITDAVAKAEACLSRIDDAMLEMRARHIDAQHSVREQFDEVDAARSELGCRLIDIRMAASRCPDAPPLDAERLAKVVQDLKDQVVRAHENGIAAVVRLLRRIDPEQAAASQVEGFNWLAAVIENKEPWTQERMLESWVEESRTQAGQLAKAKAEAAEWKERAEAAEYKLQMAHAGLRDRAEVIAENRAVAHAKGRIEGLRAAAAPATARGRRGHAELSEGAVMAEVKIQLSPRQSVPIMARRIAELEKAIRETPPHNCAAAGRPCCNPACGGKWGTGCYCCHHGKYHPALGDG
jgi:hypothetical protein